MGKTNLKTYLEIKRKLIEIFKEKQFGNNKLPSEATLAKELEISLVTLREALMMLALEGYITKRHGSGNYVHPSAFDPNNRIDLGITFADAFKQQGYEPGMQIVGVGESVAGAEFAEIFSVLEDDIISYCNIIYSADGLPSICSKQWIPKQQQRNPFEIGTDNEGFFHFLNYYCGVSITHSINEYKAVTVPDRTADILELKKGTPVIYCKQLYYNIQDKLVFYNEHYFHPERFGIKMLQNWDINQK